MSDAYRLAYHTDFTRQLESLSARVEEEPDGDEVDLLIAALDAVDVLKGGEESQHGGERLGFDNTHYDLRDCAEIKVEVIAEYSPSGKKLGPSHRMIYREFEPTADDPKPIRQIVAFEHRKNGRPFEVAAERLGRTTGLEAPELAGFPNTRPAVGRKKDPNRPITPYRLPLTPDVIAALLTAQQTLPSQRPSRSPGSRLSTAQPGPTSVCHRTWPRGQPSPDR